MSSFHTLDEVGNRIINENFHNKIAAEKSIESLREARKIPQLNVLIQEIVAALKLQEMGYNIISIRKSPVRNRRFNRADS